MKRLLIGFFLIQIVIDLAHSVTIFPFIHYGMFSESYSRPYSIPVFEIAVDGQRLLATDYPIYQWDMVLNPLVSIEREVSTHDFAFDKEKMSAGMNRAGMGALYRVMEPNLDNTPDTQARFPQWYKTYLSGLLHRPIRSLQVDKAWYQYSEGRCFLVKKENRINI